MGVASIVRSVRRVVFVLFLSTALRNNPLLDVLGLVLEEEEADAVEQFLDVESKDARPFFGGVGVGGRRHGRAVDQVADVGALLGVRNRRQDDVDRFHAYFFRWLYLDLDER